jgi:hypothetical protein
MRVFEIATEPHPVKIGNTYLEFKPEANGAAFIQAYADLRRVQDSHAGAENGDASDVIAVVEAVSAFITKFLLPGYVDAFKELDAPHRVLVQLVEYLAELYGGGAQERPTGPSSGSAARRRKPGNPGSAPSS